MNWFNSISPPSNKQLQHNRTSRTCPYLLVVCLLHTSKYNQIESIASPSSIPPIQFTSFASQVRNIAIIFSLVDLSLPARRTKLVSTSLKSVFCFYFAYRKSDFRISPNPKSYVHPNVRLIVQQSVNAKHFSQPKRKKECSVSEQ